MKILFITHESTRTGAPLMLFYFMEWLSKNRRDVDFDLFTLRSGNLDRAYKKIAKQHFEWVVKPKEGLKKQLIERVEKKIFNKKSENEDTLNKLKNETYDIIYSNSIASLNTAISIKSDHAKIVAHIHEMEVNIIKYAPNFKELIPNISHFIAASEAVKNDLIILGDIPANQISVIYEISKVNNFEEEHRNMGIFTVGGSGLVGWRKGTDIFVQIANYIHMYFGEYNIKFEWLGKISNIQRLEIESDLRKMQLTEKVNFVGEKENPQGFYQNFDVFLLTSREDPFPLVCIELGMLGKPILCFKNATGSSEMLSKQDGVIIPYFDIRAMAEKIIQLYNNVAAREQLGNDNKRIFSRFTPELICPTLMATLAQVVD